MRGLVGHTGFIGTTLRSQTTFDAGFNRDNIGELHGSAWDLLVVAAAPAVKWYANENPDQDAANLDRLMADLEAARAERVVLVSTVDVYPNPQDVDESTTIDTDGHHPYGTNRHRLERFVADTFDTSHVVRLPALFGPGLKKNLVHDLLNDAHLDWTDHRCSFQFYDTRTLWRDLGRIMDAGLELVNVVTEPIRADTVAREVFDIELTTETDRGPVHYDVHTLHPGVLGGSGDYHASRNEVLSAMQDWVAAERARQEIS